MAPSAMLGGFLCGQHSPTPGCADRAGFVLAIALVALVAACFSSACCCAVSTGADDLDQMLVTIGLMFVATAAVNLMFGSSVTSGALPEAFRWLGGPGDFAPFPGIGLRRRRLWACGRRRPVAERGPVILWHPKVRAGGRQPPIARAIGIDTTRGLYAATFAIGAALAGFWAASPGQRCSPMEPSLRLQISP